ncbi:hypothetical protein PACILC2_22350 [Paenibacillus cisolokensis]|uniref:Uncharacterized protein n=1 Tax=Paenibacillus cisolokensis TaxID=1658519 RepID=A0ABQ4N687_9BACL|nr:hypothetical protein [Paenibacillus cisolokensis]GIQ63667.1 hypothetical protein PACILC2_22350 [Paenibacillus cisolokensis]
MIKRIARAVIDGIIAFGVLCAVAYGLIIAYQLMFRDAPLWVRILSGVILLYIVVVEYIEHDDEDDAK